MPSPYPLRTERLVLRVMRTTDAAPFAAYRNDPDVAKPAYPNSGARQEADPGSNGQRVLEPL